MNALPILIPIKENSERCPNKNEVLLKYTIKYLKDLDMLANTWVISESKKLLELAKEYGANTFQEIPVPGQDEKMACLKFLEKNYTDEFILCPVTQPFRDESLVERTEELYRKEHTNLDFITSLNLITNREQFYVETKDYQCSFISNSNNRKGDSCPPAHMIDGAIYLIKTSFLKHCVTSGHCNREFWNGRIHGVINHAPFMDIDTVDDLNKFNYLAQYF